MSNERIKSALWSAKRGVKATLSDLDESAADAREQLRYYQRKVKDYAETLDGINRKKRICRREIKKIEAIEYQLNPIKNIVKAKQVAIDE